MRSCAGWRSTFCGGPSSTICPWSMKITRSETSPAKLHFVGDDHHGAPFLGELAHDGEHLADEFRIERRGRLVEEDELRLHRQHAGDRDALLLTAGEALGELVDLVAEADLLQHLDAEFRRIGRTELAHALRRKRRRCRAPRGAGKG